jgi:hypothetical protein
MRLEIASAERFLSASLDKTMAVWDMSSPNSKLLRNFDAQVEVLSLHLDLGGISPD